MVNEIESMLTYWKRTIVDNCSATTPKELAESILSKIAKPQWQYRPNKAGLWWMADYFDGDWHYQTFHFSRELKISEVAPHSKWLYIPEPEVPEVLNG